MANIRKYRFFNKTYSLVAKNNPRDKVEVEVGDIKQSDFKPQVKIMRWDNEVNFSARYKDDDKSDPVIKTKGKVIEYKKVNKEVHFYELDPDHINEDGGYEFEVILNEKPSSNVIEFSIKTKGLDFFYQPPLTKEEIKNGAYRPENVVGSYAVYHKTRKNNYIGGKEYKTGKAFHIYRPKIIDKNGEWVWGELNVDEEKQLLTVTIPQGFLDSAIYPIIVDPTFGYTSVGASIGTTAQSIFSQLATPISGGTLESISAYIRESNDGGSAPIFGYAIYNESDESFIDSTTTSQKNAPGSYDWEVLSFASPPIIVANTKYYLSLRTTWEEEITNEIQIAYDFNAGSAGDSKQVFTGGSAIITWPDPLGGTDTSSLFSIYATYTASVSTSIKDIIGMGIIPFAR